MARVLTCPRCGQTRAGASHSKGSTSLVCTACVPIATIVEPGDVLLGGNANLRKRPKRKKVSK